ESAAGKRVKCPKCGNVVVVPHPERKDEPAAEDDAERRSPQPAPETDRSSPSTRSAKTAPLNSAPEPDEPRRMKPRRSVFDDRAKELARQRYQHLSPEKPSTNLLDYSYWLLLLTFIPLAVSLLQQGKEDTVDRLVRSLEKSFPPKDEKPSSKRKVAPG